MLLALTTRPSTESLLKALYALRSWEKLLGALRWEGEVCTDGGERVDAMPGINRKSKRPLKTEPSLMVVQN